MEAAARPARRISLRSHRYQWWTPPCDARSKRRRRHRPRRPPVPCRSAPRALPGWSVSETLGPRSMCGVVPLEALLWCGVDANEMSRETSSGFVDVWTAELRFRLGDVNRNAGHQKTTRSCRYSPKGKRDRKQFRTGRLARFGARTWRGHRVVFVVFTALQSHQTTSQSLGLMSIATHAPPRVWVSTTYFPYRCKCRRVRRFRFEYGNAEAQEAHNRPAGVLK